MSQFNYPINGHNQAVNEIGYKDWQAIIRLPYLIMFAIFVEQRLKLHKEQINVAFEMFEQLNNINDRAVLTQVFSDALKEIPEKWGDLDGVELTCYIASCAISIETARRVFSSEDFYDYSQFMQDLLNNMNKALPWRKKFIAQFNKKPLDNKFKLATSVAQYLQETIER